MKVSGDHSDSGSPAKHGLSSIPNVTDLEASGISKEANRPLSEGQDERKGDCEIQIVSWEGPNDAENPLNWAKGQKWTNLLLISFQATLSPMASTILAVADLEIAKDFRLASGYLPTLPVALFVLGTGLGPLYLAPCSELYGRRAVYVLCFALFTILNIGCALAPNITVLSILRLLSGMAGSAGPSLGGGSVADMFERKDRGKAQAVYAFGPTSGPVLGGVVGGFMVYGTGGWRWLMWIMVIAPGLTVVASFYLLKETYGPFILSQKAKKMRKSTGRLAYQADLDTQSPKRMFALSITRPLRMLLFSPICTIMSLYMSLIYGVLYLHLVTIPLLFGPVPVYGLFSYRWQNGTTGLACLGAGSGSIIGTLICAKYLNKSYAYMAARKKRKTGSDEAQSEFRLPFLQLGMLILPLGLIMFAWSAEEQTHWIVPLFGAAIFAVGMLMGYVCIQTYLVDTFDRFAASALAATILLRGVVSCIFSVVGVQLYKNLGYAWGTMLVAFLCIAMSPAPLILYIYGPRIRQKGFVF